MKTWIIFLRGINVGGKNKLPMAELRACLDAQAFSAVKTYIQSGNVIFRAAETAPQSEVERRVKAAIQKDFGLDIPVMAITPEGFAGAMASNPFGQTFDKPNFMFLFFCKSVPEAPDIEGLHAVKTENEKLKLIKDVCYAYAGDGAGRSKMFAKIERSLGVPATARNWRTLEKIVMILKDEYGET